MKFAERAGNVGTPQGSIFVTMFFLLYIHDLADDVNYNIIIYGNDNTLYFHCECSCDFWEQENLNFKI